MEKMQRAEIIVTGFVQGVGFRYFVYHKAESLNLVGYVKNLPSGEVLTVAEGERHALEELLKYVKVGPMGTHVSRFTVEWLPPTDDFIQFEVQ